MNHKFAQYFFPGVLILCLFIGVHANLIQGSRILMLALTAVVLIAAHFIAPQLNKLSGRHFAYLLGGGLLLMLAGQIWSLTTMPVTVYHDPFRVLAQADQLAAGNHVWTSTYFWRYANNVPLAYLLSLWLRLGALVGLSTNTAVHMLSLLTLDGFIILLLHTVHTMSRRNSITFAAFAFVALTPFAYTYYLQVFYSDLPTMFVLLAVLNQLLHWRQSNHRQRIYRGIGLTLLTMLGYLLKPSLIVLIPALGLTALILGAHGLLKKSKLLIPALLIVLGIGLSVPATKIIDGASDFSANNRYAFPITHWIYMGYNPGSKGKYSGKDTGTLVAMHSKQARQQYDLQQLPKRLQKLGFVGIVKLWATKLGALFDVHGIQSWYNGGYRTAPKWYVQNAQLIQYWLALVYQVASVALLLALAIRLLGMPTLQADGRSVVLLLSIITALGYLAFHTLVWETEARYGQALVPLLWLAYSGLPVTQTKKLRWREIGLGAAGLALPLLFLKPIPTPPSPIVVAAQRSQMSVQYNAKPAQLAPGRQYTQRVHLAASANYLSVQIHKGSHVAVTLTKLGTKQVVHLYHSQTVYKTHRNLSAGTYTIRVRNPYAHAQSVDLVTTNHYQLAGYPLQGSHDNPQTTSFVYTVMRK